MGAGQEAWDDRPAARTSEIGDHDPSGDSTEDVVSASISTAADDHLQQIALYYRILQEVARRRADELPGLLEAMQDDVVVTSGGTRMAVLGWFEPGAWQHRGRQVAELMVNADRRRRHAGVTLAEDTITTLLHEACHVYAHSTGIKDTSRNGRYHNRRFAELALAVGLHVTRHPALGHVTPHLASWALSAYSDLLGELHNALVLVREPALSFSDDDNGGGGQTAAGKSASRPELRSKSMPKYTFASCRCPATQGRSVSIRVARGSWRPETIRCTGCGSWFEESQPSRRNRAASPGL